MMHYLRDILVAKVAPGASELMELPDETSELEAFAGEFSEEDLLRALEVLTEAESALRSSPEPRFHLEMAL
jgi:DNA polymerase III gamma/tau subunit